MRRAILQIGTEKTGTTTLQAFLARNRDLLAARGVLYPRFPGEMNHTGLAAYAMEADRADALRDALGLRGPAGVEAFRRRFEAAAAAELGDAGTVVFCNEHCHSRLKTEAEVARLRALLAPHFDRIEVAVYLRRQDQVALSLYSTRLKSGGTGTDILPRCDPRDPYFNYDVLLRLWEGVFGRDHLHPRLFERSELVGGDVVRDFLAAWDLGSPGEYRPVANLNESIRPEAQDFLRRVNAHLAPVGDLPVEVVQGPLAAALAQLMPGRGARPARAEAEAFQARYREANEAVRRRHFPHRAALFDEGFAAYPEDADRLAFDADAVARVAAALHRAAVRETRRLEAEIAIRDARLHWERGEADATLAALRRAVGWLPDHAESHRALGEYLHRLGRSAEAVPAARRALELRPDRADFWHFLGVALRAAGDAVGAGAAQERALALDPGHSGAARALAALRPDPAIAAE